jgi:hypothetical protein
MVPEVEQAIAEVRATFPDNVVMVEEEEQGGAYVFVEKLSIGEQYVPATSWVGFLITFQYPRADVYPHFLDGTVSRVDKQALGDAFSGPTSWRKRSAIQVSRKSNHLDSSIDSAATKLLKVLAWIRSR